MRFLLLTLAIAAHAEDVPIKGYVRTVDGAGMAGVVVSAKAEGSTITTSVYTDKGGLYSFSPLPAGKYRMWAQAIGYQTARAEVEPAPDRWQSFKLAPNADPEQTFKQLPGNLALDALPEQTENDKRMKQLVRNGCTSCHTASFPLQFRFDEAGWTAIIELMKNVNVSGSYVAKDRQPSGILDYHHKELAAYLARARGPEVVPRIRLEPRPSGEAARVEIREYDLPLDPDQNLPANFVQNDGSDWSLGTPSTMIPGWGVHDAWLDDAGNVWFTCNVPNKRTSIGRVNTKTGEVKLIYIPAKNGLAAQSHGMTRTPDGMIWFNINPGRGSLGRLDPKTEKIDVFTPPDSMSPTGGATTVDYDGRGKIWVSAPDGVLRFDPQTQQWTDYKTHTFKTANGTGVTYGAAGDRAGNGYWAVMIHDIIGVADGKTGKASEIKLSPVRTQLALVQEETLQFYKTYSQPDYNNPLPYSQGPRRMGTDKKDDVLWVGNSWGANLARIDTKTRQVTYVDLPRRMQPYHVHVDGRHRPWTNIWGGDRVMRLDPATKQWTAFDLPTRGAEPRYISVREPDGEPMQVVLPYFRARKIAVMTLR
ncbi:MAG: carboxypeptidase regulatory-like domain-containing protein [Betaproteobacteria bacterium]|nr:carboxypeptidase regulatory-like domain-containing protein [Betaproteobacteria bacterium]